MKTLIIEKGGIQPSNVLDIAGDAYDVEILNFIFDDYGRSFGAADGTLFITCFAS